MGSVSPPPKCTEAFINIDAYSKACASNDKVSFSQIVKLFDNDRHRPFLERLFTDRSLANALWSAKASRDFSTRSSIHEFEAELDGLSRYESIKAKQWQVVEA